MLSLARNTQAERCAACWCAAPCVSHALILDNTSEQSDAASVGPAFDLHIGSPRHRHGELTRCITGRQVALKLGSAFETSNAKDMMHEDTLAGHYQVRRYAFWRAPAVLP